jgi:hypothetical protein
MSLEYTLEAAGQLLHSTMMNKEIMDKYDDSINQELAQIVGKIHRLKMYLDAQEDQRSQTYTPYKPA